MLKVKLIVLDLTDLPLAINKGWGKNETSGVGVER
jgi:hypothetical protein